MIHAIGLDPNPEAIPAGEFELKFNLPGDISSPFSSMVEAVGDTLNMSDDEETKTKSSLVALGYFKAARQLYATMLDHEKSLNQPLKAVYYDETPIPVHMGAALGIIGHLETKIGRMIVKNATTLFKRWIVQGLIEGNQDGYPDTIQAERLVWEDPDGLSLVQSKARDLIESLTDQTYNVNLGTEAAPEIITVSMPKLRTQALQDYYNSIHNGVPDADVLRDLVSLLQMSLQQWRNRNIPNGRNLANALGRIQCVRAGQNLSSQNLREDFESWVADYTVATRWRVESLFKTGPPPAGSNGYGAQLVDSQNNVARWQMPLSDADVSMGFMFSPNKSFTMYPKLIAYSRRSRDSVVSNFAYRDGKPFMGH